MSATAHEFETRVRASFARQGIMAHLGARMTALASGYCELRTDYRPELTQQHGLFHGGVVGTLADSAAGYAGYTLMPEHSSVLTVEYKINFIAPARGEELIARGEVVRGGRTLVVTQAQVFTRQGDEQRQCASLLQTLMCLHHRPDDA